MLFIKDSNNFWNVLIFDQEFNIKKFDDAIQSRILL